MNSSHISKIEKARRYAAERESRITFTAFEVAFRGDNDSYTVRFGKDGWDCSCDYFSGRGLCCHTMTMERVLAGMMAPGTQARERSAALS